MKLDILVLAAAAAIFAFSESECYGKKVYTVTGSTGADIQKVIDKAAAEGGGKVVVPAGTYNTASIRLRSHIDLHLEKGAILLGSTRSEDYDTFPQDVCSINPEKSTKAFVYACNCKDIAITGEGTIDGNGPSFFNIDPNSKGTYPKPPVERPLMVKFVRCQGVRLEGITLKDSPCWTTMLRLCEDIDVDGISIIADQRMINNDGIDLDGCRNARIRNSRFKTCDDCIVLRAIKEYPEQEVVCENIKVSNCDLNSACQTVRLGCPSDGTIRHARFIDIKAQGYNGIFADFPTRYLSKSTTGCVNISDIKFTNYSGEFDGSALQIVSQPGVTSEKIDGFVFKNFNVKSAKPLRFIGNAGYEIGSVLLENFTAVVEAEGEPCKVAGCNGLVYKKVSINGEACPDGAVSSEKGSDAALIPGISDSWERR